MSVISFIKHMSIAHLNTNEYYQNMNFDIVPGLNGVNSKHWMNVGYWKGVQSYNQACENLAAILSRAGGFCSSDTLLDVGCGSGEQDFYWNKLYPGISIKAIDLLNKHIDQANERQNREKKSSITFMSGNAANLPFAAQTFSKVSALDCAYHFDSREDFFMEASRVLLPGGVLVLTDMLPLKGSRKDYFWKKKWRQGLFIPEENLYDIDVYKKKLMTAGFSQVKVKHIGQEVFTGLAWYFLFRFLHSQIPIDQLRIPIRTKSFYNSWYPKIWGGLFGTEDYVLVKAVK